MAQQERKRKHIRTSGFLLLLPRFVLRKQVHVKQLDWPEHGMPPNKSLFQLQGENGFWKVPELWGTKASEEHTSFSGGNELYRHPQ